MLIGRNGTDWMGVNPEIWTRVFLGMPGIRKRTNIAISDFGSLMRNSNFSSLLGNERSDQRIPEEPDFKKDDRGAEEGKEYD